VLLEQLLGAVMASGEDKATMTQAFECLKQILPQDSFFG
jgi:hypothetical protein